MQMGIPQTMNWYQAFGRRFSLVALATTIWSFAPIVAMAQNQQTAPVASPWRWWSGYALVILAIILGVAAVCRPVNRDEWKED